MRYKKIIGLLPVLFLLLTSFSLKERASRSSNKGSENKHPSFTLTDENGKQVSLSDFKGKFVYLDFWASWCNPCMSEMPDTRRLQNDLKDKDMIWIFVSFDKDDVKWKKTVKAHGLKGIQLMAGDQNEFLKKEFNFDSIPFYVWINKDGEMVMHDAPRPSAGGTERKLLKFIDK
jgi:thiol-disulfide isomerase/thioredoxin